MQNQAGALPVSRQYRATRLDLTLEYAWQRSLDGLPRVADRLLVRPVMHV